MTEKEIVLETIRALLPDDYSLEEIAEHIDFLAAVEGSRSTRQRRRHFSRRSKKTAGLMAYKLIWSRAARDDLHDICLPPPHNSNVQCLSDFEMISEANQAVKILQVA